MKRYKTSYSKEFDNLFEKPIVKTLDSKRMKVLVLISVIVVGLLAAAPFIFLSSSLFIGQSVMKSEGRKLSQFEASQPFVVHKILKENIRLESVPNYRTAKNYEINISNSPDRISFSNGYDLDIKNSQGLSDVLKNTLPRVKATEGDSSIDSLAIYNFQDIDYPKMSEPLTIEISGNLIGSYELQLSKTKGSWAKILSAKTLKGGAKSGYIINYDAKRKNGKSFIMIMKYWIFSDGVGIIINDNSLIEPVIDHSVIDGMSEPQLIKEINTLTNGRMERLQDNFVLQPNF